MLEKPSLTRLQRNNTVEIRLEYSPGAVFLSFFFFSESIVFVQYNVDFPGIGGAERIEGGIETISENGTVFCSYRFVEKFKTI